MGRTDEGTPIALSDFKGRMLAIFLIGEGFTPSHQNYLKQIADRTDDFLRLDCSPIAISTEPEEILASFRESEKLPFLLISDTNSNIYKAMLVPGQNANGSWLINEDGIITSFISHMNPREQVAATVAAQLRIVES